MNEHPVPQALLDKLVDLGSTQALAREVGDEAAARAMHDLTQRAPEEIQPSWPYVIAWARMQRAYEAAARIGDVSGMLKASEAQAKLIRDVY